MRRMCTGAALPLLAMLAACNDAGPSSLNQLSFNLATRASAPAASSAASFAVVSTPETFTDGTNTLVINKVELVLREIELRRSGAAECVAGTGDDCEELEIGPVLVDLPLGTAGASRDFSVQIAPGTYDRVEFELHKPSTSDDAGFVQANPAFDGTSVRVTGTYNGTTFEYTTDLNAEMEFDLVPALVANETGATDLTLFVDLDKWFRDASGALVDPETGNHGGINEGLVEQNIQSALDAFEDDNHDGRDDGPNHQ
jgi:hypothetical protein